MREHSPRRPIRLVAILLATVGLAALAVAGPAATRAAAAPTPPINATEITITSVSPEDLSLDSTITVKGAIVNKTPQNLTNADIRLQSGARITSRATLGATGGSVPDAEKHACEFQSVGQTLPVGKAVPFTATCAAKTLGFDADGVYPLMVNLNADQFDGSRARVGEGHFYLPYFHAAPAAPTRVAILWPIIDQPHERADGVFVDDQLAVDLAPGGRLYRLVDTGLQALAGEPALQITVMLDPELVGEVLKMAGGYQVLDADGKTTAGSGAVAATRWMTMLRQLVTTPGVAVAAVAYADADIVALQDAGLTDQVSSAFTIGGGKTLATELGVPLLENLVWPTGGKLDDETLNTLSKRQIDGIVLSPQALPVIKGTSTTPTADAVASLPGQGVSTTALVTDPVLDQFFAPTSYTVNAQMTEARFLNELAMITAENPSLSRSAILVPPRRWDINEGYTLAVLRALTSTPWVSTAATGDLLSQPPGSQRGPLQEPSTTAQPADGARAAEISRFATSLDGFRQMLANANANTLLTPYYRGLLLAASSAWNDHPEQAQPFLQYLRTSIRSLRDTVQIVEPETKVYTLASTNSPIVVTVANTLNVPVKVRVTVIAQGSAGFTATPVDKTLQPNSRTGIQVPTHVVRSGDFSIIAEVRTPSNELLGESVQLHVHSTAYGTITLAITGGALGLLFILVCRRLYQRIRRGRANRKTAALQMGTT